MNTENEASGGDPNLESYERPALIIGASRQEPKAKIYAQKTIKCISRSIRTLFRWANLFAAVVACASVGQYFMAQKQWETANRALKAADETVKSNAAFFEISNRPYVTIESVTMRRLRDGSAPSVDVKLSNGGR